MQCSPIRPDHRDIRRTLRPAAFVLLIAGLLAGCQRALEPPAGEFTALQPPPGSQPYTVQSQRSFVRIRVYRAGRLAALGHNHVLYSDALEGTVHLGEDPAGSAFSLRLPVTSLSVDDPAQRALAGDGFSAEPDADAIAGTRTNMLGDDQLNADAWPQIQLRSVAARGDWDAVRLQVDTRVAGRQRRIEIPAVVQWCAGELQVQGSFAVRQTELGLVPFSVMLGALQVRDTLEIDYRLVAVAAAGSVAARAEPAVASDPALCEDSAATP